MQACEMARVDGGYTRMDAYTPFPVHGIRSGNRNQADDLAIHCAFRWTQRLRRCNFASVVRQCRFVFARVPRAMTF